MRGCEVLFGVERAVEVRELMAGCGVPCPCQGETCPGCPIMGDWGQRARLSTPDGEVSRGSSTVAAYRGSTLKRGLELAG